MIRTVSPQNAQLHLDELLDGVREDNDIIVLESDGQVLGAVISADEYEKFLKFRLQHAWAVVECVQGRNADLEPDDVLADLEFIVKQVRQERNVREWQTFHSDH